MRARLRSSVGTGALGAVLALAVAAPAFAGAWPRDPGAAFVSLRSDLETSDSGPETSASVYGEYGLTRRITLIGQLSNSDDAFTVSRAAASVQYALSPADAVNRFAVGLGLSTPPDLIGMMTDTRLETAVHWGRGFESRFGGGWATASLRVLFDRDEKRPITDLYGLVGLRPADGVMTMLSASRYHDGEGVYYKITPSIAYQVRKNVWIVPSFTQELSEDRSTGVGVALWVNF